MKLLKILLVVSALGTSLSAFAGTWSSGGGSAVVCFRDPAIAAAVTANKGMVANEQLAAIDSIEMFDIFEWNRPRGIDGKRQHPLAQPREGEGYVEFVKRIIRRAYDTIAHHSSNTDAGLGNHLWGMELNWLETRWGRGENVIWTGTSLVHLADEHTPIRFGGNCALVPIAVQQGEGYAIRLFIDDRLFFHPRHSEQSRAALFVHEMIYAMARELGHQNSSATRQATGLIMQNNPETRITDVMEKLNTIGFTSRVPGIARMNSYQRMNAVSVAAYHYYYHVEASFPLWNDRNFRAQENGKTEAELVAEAENALRKSGINFPVGMNANRAWAYLSEESSRDTLELRAELDQLIKAKAAAIRGVILESLGEKPLDSYMVRVEYFPENFRAFIHKRLRTRALDRVIELAERRVTEEQLAALRKKGVPYVEFPLFVMDEFLVPGESDGKFTRWSYWLHVMLASEISADPRDFSLLDLKVPVL